MLKMQSTSIVPVVLALLLTMTLFVSFADVVVQSKIDYGPNIAVKDTYVQSTATFTGTRLTASYTYTEIYNRTDSALPITIVLK